jgi:DNA-directed RNA polymerase II subunit RPB2
MLDDLESNKKNIVIANSALSSNENKEEGKETMEGGAKKAKQVKAAAAAEEGAEAAAAAAEEGEGEGEKKKKEGEQEGQEGAPPQSPSKQKKKKEKKSDKKLGLDVGEEVSEVGEQAKPSSSSSSAAAADTESEMSQLLNETIPWNIIDKLFSDNPNILVAHQLDSYNEFISNGISQIFKEHNPIVFQKEKNLQTDAYKHISRFYLGGKTGDKIYYGKPVIYDETGTTSRVHYMYPNEARLRNMTYGVTIHYDVDVEFEQEQQEQQEQQAVSEAVSSSTKKIIKKLTTVTLPQILLGKFPIMVHSDLCILSGLPKDVIYNMGEDKSDHGGYFIIDGKEKLIVSQEIFADNMLYTRTRSADDKYSHSVEIRTVSEDTSKPERKLRVYMVAPTPKYTNNQIVVEIPNVKRPIPLFILMRALGVISDYDIIETCLLNMAENRDLIELFRPSVHDANKIFTQRAAIEYIGLFVKGKGVVQSQNILMNFFLPQIGELNFQSKAFFLGYMVNKLVRLKAKIDIPIDRDSLKFKRVKIPGKMLHSLFNEYYAQQIKRIRTLLDFKYNYNYAVYQENFIDIVKEYDDIFKDRIVEDGLRRAFKGNWGGSEFTKEAGIVQDLNRLSYNSAISHLRKVNLPLDDSAKVIKPRLLHGSQWCLMDPVDVPDSGLQKHFAISTHVTNGCKGSDMIQWLLNEPGINLLSLEKYPKDFLYYQTKVFVNGNWVGVVSEPEDVVQKIKKCRRLSMIPIYISCSWDIQMREINIFTDGGRPCRPAYYYDPSKKMYAFQAKSILKLLTTRKFSWKHLVGGFGIKQINHNSFFTTTDMTNIVKLYDKLPENITFEKMMNRSAVVEYIDVSEENNAMFAFRPDDKVKPGSAQFTHSDIHPSLMFGVMGNLISFPENNQLPRNVFSCSQSKQAVSMYNTSFLQRFDKMGVVLNNGQIPLVKTRYLKYFNDEQNPYGQNVMVAIMSYNGYNVEDSILFNEGSIKRGLFRTSYYNMYETREESKQSSGDRIDTRVLNMNDYQQKNAIANAWRGEGYDYSNLDSNGLIIENTPVSEKSVLIGQVVSESKNSTGKVVDASIRPKKGQIGYVDKTYITEGSNPDIPSRIAKVRIREDRAPNIGDKFASRCGQKGTVGLIIPEQDMPFTSDGIRPDLIVNPHAFPSRMTIGQFVETVMAKACVIYGAFGDCTAFVNLGNKHETFGNMLLKENYSSSGTQILYNGTTGEQIESEIFIGPTYYMRLKHMVKDKINFRARGPNTNLTRQPVQGRANDGGLRIGEMERDGIIGHGAAHFLQESMLIRGDVYYMAICNKTGMTAIYNPDNDVFMSPMADGPIEFNDALTDNPKLVNITRFGRSFSVVQIPYSFKLLIQELQTMNCVMRIITEDNINQIESMSFSNNYKLLSGEKTFASIDTSLMKGGNKNADNTQDDDGIQLLISSDDASLQQGGNGNEDATTMDNADNGDNADMDINADFQNGGRTRAQRQPMPMTQNIVMNCSPNSSKNPNYDTNLEATSTENMGKEWIEMVDPESKKKYFYNEKTKETMWYQPNPAKDYEYRPPNGWYTITIGEHDYYHNPEKNFIKMREDVTPADANPVNEDETTGKDSSTHDDDDSTPSILMVQKNDEVKENEDGSSSDSSGTKKIII